MAEDSIPSARVHWHDSLKFQGQNYFSTVKMTITSRKLAVPKTDLDDYYVVLASFVLIVYRFTNVDDIVLSLTDATRTDKYLYLRYTFPEESIGFGKLYDGLKEQLKDVKRFEDREKLTEYLKTTVEVSYSQLRDFDNYSFNVGTTGTKDIDSFEFSVTVNEDQFLLNYNAEKYSGTLVEQFTQLLQLVVADPSRIVTTVPLVTASQTSLPDPTKDLDWSGYVGAIHEIFERNAGKWPDRACVIETNDLTGTSNRVFNYRQINEASNVIAHYLVSNGIEVGDIVTIYSSRSVELLVCVLGILKAGATFSVIDPAYPPERQTIYLSVADPRGLIVIGKAGTLDDVVEEYIAKNLHLKARLLEVVIQDNGVPLGGLADGVDALAKYLPLAAKSTGVKVGPDSNPTLAFTSGSEGIPKGVLGRHFSLAYYFPWMAKTFGLSEADNFTMLSGIAHDPVQRDMFTPIFLGAKLYIPTADDIGTPGRLAKWMKQYNITVTHLTPAMGQVLSAQAVDEIPTLANAFFVGDLLTRKDCLRLQSLAKNVRIINMYGTTETQRAVSYFPVKSYNEDPQFLSNLKDIVPAGQGMKNVQLLVVNRIDPKQTCGVGEVGELFVRAGGLAEGYRGLPKANAEKFLTNWFTDASQWKDTVTSDWLKFGWKGPRDRLYRTGDLGRYLSDGNVEVTGRIDDQIKIRGFRIELGEIDTHVSKFPILRENRTIVKKDENNETYLISFLVLKSEDPQYYSDKFNEIEFDQNLQRPELVKSLVKHHKLASELKKFLNKKLASYAVPSLVVVLPKFPLNPNGKIDKNKLPVPTPEELEVASKYLYQLEDVPLLDNQDHFSELQRQIKDIWFDILPNKPVINSLKDSFFDLGGHSILATRMIFQVRKAFNVDLPLGTVFKHPTIEGFSGEIERSKKGETSAVAAAADYSADAKKLSASLPNYPPLAKSNGPQAVFVTGCTGFLGSFLIKQFLTYAPVDFKVYAHVRAATKEKGLARLVNSLKVYDNLVALDKLEVVVGDLSKPQFGLPDSEWTQLNQEVSTIVHNGAMVHWGYPYQKLRDSNVISTINVMNMASFGRPKTFNFVSSTSVLDTLHYFELSDKCVSEGKSGILESDSLQGSSKNLGTGYGQSKWAAEYIIRQAGLKGLTGYIVRPGYITGSSINGSSNTDDFLLRMLKGCVEIGAVPDISNATNAVPVDHVSRIVLATTVESLVKEPGVEVAHVTGHPRIALNDYLLSVNHYGYLVKQVAYAQWKTILEEYIKNHDSSLYPLLHMVLGDLKNDTLAPELDDTNTVKALKYEAQLSGRPLENSAKGLTVKLMGVYISYLVKIGFLPESKLANLPEVQVSSETIALNKAGAGGRASAAK